MARECKRTRADRKYGKAERLADTILASSGFDIDSSLKELGHLYQEANVRTICAFARNVIPLSVVVDASNILSYVHGTYGQTKSASSRGGSYEYRDIKNGLRLRSLVPNWKPPFRRMFIEMSGTTPWRSTKKNYTLGYLFSESEPSLGGDGSTQVCVWKFTDGLTANGMLYPPEIGFEFKLDPDGQIVGNPTLDQISYGAKRELDCAESLSDLTAFLAISFMHCKNVSVNAIDPDRKLNRTRQRNGLKPFLRYHTIDIEPMKAVLRNEGGIETNGLGKALHICRGHFATYGEDRPLFGRSVGTFWVPSHTRGSFKRGVIKSDYRVNAPEAES